MTMYILLCVISVLTGFGISKVLRLPISSWSLLSFAPILALCFWILALGWGLSWGYTVKELSYVIWGSSLVLSMLGVFLAKNENAEASVFHWYDAVAHLLTIALPVLAMLPYFSHGLANYIGSDAPDGWSYVAQGQYLWGHALGSHGGLSPLYEYAASLGNERFVGAALLAYLSPLTGHAGDSQQATNLFLAWILFVFASSCIFFANSYRLGKWTPWYLTLVVLSGWVLGMLAVNNFDNAIFVCILPSMFAAMHINTQNKMGWFIVIAALISCVFYSYVQFSPFVLLAAILLFMQNKKMKFGLAATLLLVFIFILPHLDQTIYSWKRLDIPTGIERPGEGYFRGLVQSKYFLAAFWGMRAKFIGECLGVILTLLAVRGLIVLWREKQIDIIVLCVLFLLAAIEMAVVEQYSYGAYKFLAMNAFLMFYCVIKGMEFQSAKINYQEMSNKRVAMLAGLFALWIVYLGQGYYVQQAYAKQASITDVSDYRRLSHINVITEKKAIAVNIESLVANEWAVYFLRDIPIKLVKYKGYMIAEGAQNYLRKAKKITSKQLGYTLSDSTNHMDQRKLLWIVGPYRLYAR